MPTRRELLTSSSLALFGSVMTGSRPAAASLPPVHSGGPIARSPVKPARLKEGDTVGLVLPSFAQWDPVPLDILLDTLKALGLKAKLGRHHERNPGLLARLVLVALIIAGAAVQSYYGIARLVGSSYRHEVAFWQEIGDLLGHEASVIGLTQDYGYRLAYWGWQSSAAWVTSGDIEVRYMAGQSVDVEERFAEDIAGKDFFVVTTFGEFDSQPVVKEILTNDYPVFAQTDEYIIFDLRKPNDQP